MIAHAIISYCIDVSTKTIGGLMVFLTHAIIVFGLISFTVGTIAQLRPDDAKKKIITWLSLAGGTIATVGLYLLI